VIPLAALPWPAVVAQGWIGSLRVELASLVAEILNATGEPARSTGTVIQVSRGYIEIDEACGGIRSLQTAVLVALVIGELRRESPGRRACWLGGGIATALLANALRIGTLAVACAKGGPAALERWHDRAGALEIVFTLGVLGAAALWAGIPPLPRRVVGTVRTSRAGFPAWVLLLVVIVAEAGTFLWFGFGARWGAHPTRWTAHLPASAPSFSASPFTPTTQELLQCDTHEIGTWQVGGSRRAGYVLRWETGHFAQYAVRLHNPEVCLTFAGSEVVGTRPAVFVQVGNLNLPFLARDFRQGSDVFHVYFLPWNLSAGAPLSLTETAEEKTRSWFARQWDEVLAHRRSLEAIEVAYAVFDLPDPAKADAAFRREITGIVAPE
jgi:exosortase/archaeosortase family protein